MLRQTITLGFQYISTISNVYHYSCDSPIVSNICAHDQCRLLVVYALSHIFATGRIYLCVLPYWTELPSWRLLYGSDPRRCLGLLFCGLVTSQHPGSSPPRWFRHGWTLTIPSLTNRVSTADAAGSIGRSGSDDLVRETSYCRDISGTINFGISCFKQA